MKYEVRDNSMRNRKTLLSRKSLPDVYSYQVVRIDDDAVVESYESESIAHARATELNARHAHFSLDDLMRQYAEND